MLVLSLVGCGNNDQSSDAHDANYEEGYTAGYEAGYNGRKQQMTESKKCFAPFSGAFTATVEQFLPDYYALPGKTIAVVHFFQDRPFSLCFQEDLTGKLVEGTSYRCCLWLLAGCVLFRGAPCFCSLASTLP